MRAIRGALAGLYAAVLIALGGCGASAQTPAQQAQATASLAMITLNDAWKAAGDLCVAQADQTKCGPALATAYQAILAAGEGVDAWGSANAGNQSCAIGQAATALQAVLNALPASVQVPVIMTQAIQLGHILGTSDCTPVPVDGGAQ